jgi:hypothetical protein
MWNLLLFQMQRDQAEARLREQVWESEAVLARKFEEWLAWVIQSWGR